MTWEHWRKSLAHATEPSAGQVRRVRDRLDAQLVSTASLLRDGSEPHPVQIARVRANLRAGKKTSGVRWGVPALGGFALAALATLMLWNALPTPAVASVPLIGHLALTPNLTVDADGDGLAHGVGSAWSLDWERGAVAVAVTPNAGQQVVVNTREAEVRVIGTAFTVSRDAFGTQVAVREGRVAVDCVAGSKSELGAGESTECLPSSALGLLARAHAQAERGDGAATQLETLDRAGQLAGETAVGSEIAAARLAPLIALGQLDEARRTANAYLAQRDAPRASEVHRVAGRLAIIAGDCHEATQHLATLPDLAGEEAAWLEHCRTE